jgi:hypothetical protein
LNHSEIISGKPIGLFEMKSSSENNGGRGASSKNICAHRDGWLVQVKRSGIKYQAFFGYGPDRAASLQRAIAERDRFYDLYGRYATGHKPRSNTGLCGISETTKWSHGRPYECFSVSFQRGAVGMKRFRYRTPGDRSRALRDAVAYRARLSGEDFADLMKQAEQLEALCV